MSTQDHMTVVERFTKAQDDLVLQPSDLSLRTITNMVASGAVDLSPHFQRRERWNATKQSALIESFLLNIPVPPVYLAEDELGTYAVIDGKQRITAISSFLNNTLDLRNLEQLSELDGVRYSRLPRPMQGVLDLRPLRAVTLLRQSSPDIKFEVFQRLNTGGEVLNAQEIRNVVYRGPLNALIYELAKHSVLVSRLKITSPKSAAYRKMQDAEYVLRFLTLSASWKTFSGDLKGAMNHFMQMHRESSDDKLREFRHRFSAAIDACHALWGPAAFRRPEGNGWRDQTLAGMYDAQMLAVNEVSENIVAAAIAKKAEIVRATRHIFKDDEFEIAVRQGTNTPSRIVHRTNAMIGLLKRVVGPVA